MKKTHGSSPTYLSPSPSHDCMTIAWRQGNVTDSFLRVYFHHPSSGLSLSRASSSSSSSLFIFCLFLSSDQRAVFLAWGGGGLARFWDAQDKDRGNASIRMVGRRSIFFYSSELYHPPFSSPSSFLFFSSVGFFGHTRRTSFGEGLWLRLRVRARSFLSIHLNQIIPHSSTTFMCLLQCSSVVFSLIPHSAR